MRAAIELKSAMLGRPLEAASAIGGPPEGSDHEALEPSQVPTAAPVRELPGIPPAARIGPPLDPVRPRSERWKAPPTDLPVGVTTSMYELGARPRRFDVDLLEELNQEYREKKVVETAPKYDLASLSDATERRLDWVHGMIDLTGKRTLEIGCGRGMEVWATAHNYGADAYGVDVKEWATWSGLQGDRVHLHMSDIGIERPFPADHFDRIISFTVWEHVTHPYRLLEEAARVLKPGGLAWLRVNLFAGPQASHRYKDIYFPWPHLLFSDDVIADWDRGHGRETEGSAWVNRLTWDNYLSHICRLGLIVRHLRFEQVPLDEELYQRFENVLGRYRKWDLCTDYFTVVLQKPEVSP